MSMRDTNGQHRPGESDELSPILNGLASYFAGKPGVQAAWLFGSHCEGRSHRDSDVDLAVLLEHARDSRCGSPLGRCSSWQTSRAH